MTDAREKIARLFGDVFESDYEETDRLLSDLRLTPEAATALMDGTAVVVPAGRLTDEQVNKLGFALHDGANYPPDNAAFARGSHRAVIAALAYRSNSDAD